MDSRYFSREIAVWDEGRGLWVDIVTGATYPPGNGTSG